VLKSSNCRCISCDRKFVMEVRRKNIWQTVFYAVCKICSVWCLIGVAVLLVVFLQHPVACRLLCPCSIRFYYALMSDSFNKVMKEFVLSMFTKKIGKVKPTTHWWQSGLLPKPATKSTDADAVDCVASFGDKSATT